MDKLIRMSDVLALLPEDDTVGPKPSVLRKQIEALLGVDANGVKKHGHCPYCEAEDNDFIPLNQTSEYSGIEMMLNRQGMLRVRYYTHNDRELYTTQDIVNIKYCPNCGAKMDGGAKRWRG